VSDNVERFDEIGIIHKKSVEEQVYDDARYEQMALQDGAAPSTKRNWLQHNRTLRDERARQRRTDLEVLLPADSARVLVVGDILIEPPGRTLVRVHGDDREMHGEDTFDGAVLALEGGELLEILKNIAGRVRAGGVIVGTVPTAREQRHLEELVAGVLSHGTDMRARSRAGSTRRELLDSLSAAGLDVRWLRLGRSGWLDPVALRPDGSGLVIETRDFLLKNVPAEVAEELTADEIVFAAARPRDTGVPPCSVVFAAIDGTAPGVFADALATSAPGIDYELVVVQPAPARDLMAGAISVIAPEEAGLAGWWNAGARAATGEVLIFVSTAAVPLPGWLDALLQAQRSRLDIGAVGSKVVAEDDTVEHAGLVNGRDGVPYRLYQGHAADTPEVNRARIMPAVAGEGMAMARARFVEVGGFDETLGDDLTDADFCLRLRSRGLSIFYSPAATLRSTPHGVAGTRGHFRQSARQYATRWARNAVPSDDLVCRADGIDANGEWERSWRLPRPSIKRADRLPAVLWSSHFLEQGGYTEEAFTVVEALESAGLAVVANPVSWAPRPSPLPPTKAERLETFMSRDLPADFVHVAHVGANRFKRHPAARRNVGRTMFETDGLAPDWRDRCNAMDEVWVPSEHNLHTFTWAGVDPSKLHKVPETFDSELFDPGVTPLPIDGVSGFVFLSVFSWGRRKGWDLLLRAWFAEFDRHDDVTLLLKTDTINAPGTDCRAEVEAFVRGELGRKPRKGPRVVVLDQPLEVTDVPRLYRTSDAFVLASRGEGWGRPYMEAMAMGLPTIGTRWSGNLEFMNDDNSYLLGYELVPTGEADMQRQRWAQPSVKELRRAMRRIYEDRSEAVATGRRARADVLVSCRPELVAEAVRDRLEALDRHPVHLSGADLRSLVDDRPPRQRATERPRITVCIVAEADVGSVAECEASVRGVADEVVVVDAGPGDDMGAARNRALDRATGDWVLMLDATHTLDPASVARVRSLVARNQFVGYTAREVRQFGLDGALSAIEQRIVVLFPRHPRLRYIGLAAEELLPQDGMEFRVELSDVVVHQHEHRWDRIDAIAKARRQLPLLDRSARECPDEPFHLYNLGVGLFRLGLHEQAEVALRDAIAQAPPRARWEPTAYAVQARTLAAQQRAREAVKAAKVAVKLAPDWSPGWYTLAGVQAEAGRFDAAIRSYGRALDCADTAWASAGFADDTAWQVRAGMGRIHLARDEFAEAADWLGGAVAANPSDAQLRVWLARALEALGRSGEARRHLEGAVALASTAPEPYMAIGDFFTQRAHDALLRGLAANPENRQLLERIERLRAARAAV
jgi:glycosyltransferase involved in cell wall biosynthesis/tetratricopeptide (TPR) repeat protein